jgi:6-phospho-beta-glucosidase
VKLAVVGGGGFRVPLVYQALLRLGHGVGLDEIVLQDPEAGRLARIRSVIAGLDQRSERRIPVRVTTSPEDALDGAAFVFCAIRVGGLAARAIDEAVPLSEGVLGQETVGPGGICFALRTVPIVLDLAHSVARHAPDAWFLNFTNPAGLVTEALIGLLGDRVIGICDSPSALCRRVAARLGRRPEDLWFDYFGLNHLGWLRSARDEHGDALPGLLADDERLGPLEEARVFGSPYLRALGMIPNEYLAYYEFTDRIRDALAAAPRAELLLEQQRTFYDAVVDSPQEALAAWNEAKRARHHSYMSEAWDGASSQDTWEGDPEQDEAGYASVAARLMRAIALNTWEILILDVANRSSLPFLDETAVVEVPCVVGASGAVPVSIGPVPERQRAMIERLKEVERLTIRASVEGSAKLALEALAAHPVVPSREAAERVLAGYLARHRGLQERLR